MTGSGTANNLTKWTGTTSLGASLLYDSGTGIGIGTNSPNERLEVTGNIRGTAIGSGNTWGVYLKSHTGTAVSKWEVAGSQTNHAVTFGAVSNNPLYFITAGSTRMTIMNTGEVGIGTTTPIDKLQIKGGALSINSDAADGATYRLRLIGNTTTGYGEIQGHPSYGLLINKEGGNVGIGTTSPGAKLHLFATGATNFIRMQADYATDVDFGFYLDSGGFYIKDFTNTKLPLIIEPNTPSNTLYLDSAGYVGIGTTAPVAKLDIVGTTSDEIRLYVASVADTPKLHFRNSGGTDSYIWQNSAGTILFGTEDVDTGAMAILRGGNVGIGTTAPATKLETSRSNSGAHWTLDRNGTDIGSIGVDSTDINIALIGGTTQALNIRSSDGGTTVARFAENGDSYINGGNVGIGTTNPGAKLDVNGTIRSVNSSNIGEFSLGLGQTLIANGYGGAISSFGIKNWDGTDYFDAIAVTGSTHYVLLAPIEGNVGIGTTAPGRLLHLDAGAASTYMRLETDAGYSAAVEGFQGATQKFSMGYYPTADAVELNYGDLTSGHLVIKSTGNVGIGTTSPTAKLHVNGSAIINGTLIGLSNATDLTGAVTLAQLQAVNTTANIAETDPYWTANWTNYFTKGDVLGFNYYNSTTLPSRVSGSGTAWYIPMWNGTTSLNNSAIFQNGSNIGIGTTSPSAKLNVVGEVNFSSSSVTTFTEGGALVVSG